MYKPLVSIQILNWNRGDETLRAIRSALNQSYDNSEIVVIDNGSTDDSVALINKEFPDINVVCLDRNYGCPGGRNIGVDYCKGELVFFLDNDGVLHKNAVNKAVSIMLKNPSYGVVTGVVYDFDDVNEIDTEIALSKGTEFVHHVFQGGISMHRKSMYLKTGLYPADFVYGAEELFLTYKIYASGYLVVKSEEVVLWHKRSDLARDRTNELLNAYYNKLHVAISLYPTANAMLFTLYFIPAYLYYGYKEGIAAKFIVSIQKRFFPTILKAFRERTPVSAAVYNRVQKIRVSKDI